MDFQYYNEPLVLSLTSNRMPWPQINLNIITADHSHWLLKIIHNWLYGSTSVRGHVKQYFTVTEMANISFLWNIPPMQEQRSIRWIGIEHIHHSDKLCWHWPSWLKIIARWQKVFQSSELDYEPISSCWIPSIYVYEYKYMSQCELWLMVIM